MIETNRYGREPTNYKAHRFCVAPMLDWTETLKINGFIAIYADYLRTNNLSTRSFIQYSCQLFNVNKPGRFAAIA